MVLLQNCLFGEHAPERRQAIRLTSTALQKLSEAEATKAGIVPQDGILYFATKANLMNSQ
jgi:hypothetical protein